MMSATLPPDMVRRSLPLPALTTAPSSIVPLISIVSLPLVILASLFA